MLVGIAQGFGVLEIAQYAVSSFAVGNPEGFRLVMVFDGLEDVDEAEWLYEALRAFLERPEILN